MRRYCVLLVFLFTLPAHAKSLQWRAVEVKAHLERDGSLHVVESLTFVFDGDWNGGERSFHVRGRQELELSSLSHDGSPLTEGDLDAVGEYAWDGHTLRWRSRLPTDPPFVDAERTYVIDYVLSNVLERTGETYLLHHDFAMPAANAPIEAFSLQLTFDEVWQGAAPVMMPAVSLPAGRSMVITRNMTYTGAGLPAGVRERPPVWIGGAAVVIFLFGAALLLWRFLHEETANGRMKPLAPSSGDIEDVLALRAEAAGLAWDGHTGPNEVAATLARLTQERKITSWVHDDVLHMRLEVGRSTLHGYERDLIARLFVGEDDETDTDTIRARYAAQGFDPAEVIRPGVEQQLIDHAPWQDGPRRFATMPHILSFAAALALLILAAAGGAEADLLVTVLAFVTGSAFGLGAAIYAAHQARRVAEIGSALVVLSLIYVPSLGVLLFSAPFVRLWDLFVLTPFAVALWHLACLHLILDLLRIRDTPEKLAFRRKVAAVRAAFERELRLPRPQIRDEWFPYIIAFGLGRNAARWFRSFGSSIEYGTGGSSSVSSSSSSSSSGPSSWTGGGGAFGGAGATGSWAVAAAAVSSGVAAPSSSGGSGGGSSSGGGGGSSSGGGGGGGW